MKTAIFIHENKFFIITVFPLETKCFYKVFFHENKKKFISDLFQQKHFFFMKITYLSYKVSSFMKTKFIFHINEMFVKAKCLAEPLK